MESLWGVTYGNSTFVVVDDNETGGVGTLLASSDGTTWTSRTSGTTNILNGVAYGNNTIVTVGKGGKIFTSDKGTTWTSETSATAYNLMGITYANSKFVEVGYNGNILTSSDGTY